MGTLFAKLFLWFWLSMIAIASASWLARHHWVLASPLPGAAEMQEYAAEIERLYELAGMPAVQAHLRRMSRRDQLRFVILPSPPFASTNPVANANAPGRSPPRVIAGDPLRADGTPLTFVPARTSTVTVVLDGEPFVLSAVFPRGRLPDVPMWVPPTLALGITGLLSAAFALHLSGPVRRVREASRRLATGEFSVRVPTPRGRGDEITALGRDFNAMAIQLQALLESHKLLLRDISHELRSPLARLQTALELVRRQGGEGLQGAVERMHREIERLDELVGQVLALARLESGAYSLHREPVDVGSLLEEICDDARFELGSEQKRLSLDCAPASLVQADRALLRSALENVIRNALRHTPAGSSVEVACTTDAERGMTVRIRDHGQGVPEAELERILEPFVRTASTREHGPDGHGLGLAIARRALELHGGALCASNAPGGGLLIEVQMPPCPPA